MSSDPNRLIGFATSDTAEITITDLDFTSWTSSNLSPVPRLRFRNSDLKFLIAGIEVDPDNWWEILYYENKARELEVGELLCHCCASKLEIVNSRFERYEMHYERKCPYGCDENKLLKLIQTRRQSLVTSWLGGSLDMGAWGTATVPIATGDPLIFNDNGTAQNTTWSLQ